MLQPIITEISNNATRCQALWILGTAMKNVNPAKNYFSNIVDPGCGLEQLVGMDKKMPVGFDPEEFIESAFDFLYNCK